MEVKVNIDKNNKSKVLELISQLVDAEANSHSVAFSQTSVLTNQEEKDEVGSNALRLLTPSPSFNLSFGNPKIGVSEAGSWGMFNSFLPGKAALRILVHLMEENNGPVTFEKFIKSSLKAFKAKGLTKYRGFPKEKASSSSRTEWHLIRPYADLGLIEITETPKGEIVSITKNGLEFANLQNPILDCDDDSSVLSSQEQKWLISHLKSIEKEGYFEYSILKEFFQYLQIGKRSYDDLRTWFSCNKRMLNYLKTWSRKKDDSDAFASQVENVAGVFVTGKMALLRELGLVSSKRNDYSILNSM